MRNKVRKTIRILVYLAYYNICLIRLANGIYFDIITLTIVTLDQFFAILDVIMRPKLPREDIDSTTRMIGFLFLLHPFFLILLFYENLAITSILLVTLDNHVISYIGVVVYIVGALILVLSRKQLGRYGDGTTELKGDHALITQGIYRYIRHPLYSGGLIGRIGIGLAFRGYIGMICMTLIYFIVFRKRMDIEEKSLTSEFGDEYEEYLKRTKRLFPYIY